MKEKEKLTYPFAVEKGGKGEKRTKNHIAFKAEVHHSEWLDNCFIGKTVEPNLARDMKESFILGGFKFIQVRFMGGNCVLLSGEDVNLIKKTIEENKEWFESIFESITPWEKEFTVSEKFVWARIRGLPLNLWSRHSLESIVAMVGTLVEIDKDTLEMEELEFARVLIKLPVARDVRWSNCMKINETICQIAIEEEPVNKIRRSQFGERGINSDDELGSFAGREGGESEESKFGSNLFFHGGVGEDTTVEEAELRRREVQNQYATTTARCDDVEA